MSKEKFTPGPWVARVEYKKSRLSNQTYMLCSVHADDKCITDSVYVIHDNMDEAAANTRLIAAAPEMYEFIRWIRSVQGQCAIMKWRKFLPEILDKADEILHKAEGEE